MDKGEIMAKCDQAADAIATLPASEWSDWAVYLLEVLDGRLGWVSSEADRRAALEGVANALQTRLQTGIW